ncbi:hypothetical protein [Halorussus marinus]|uniref:hypothetical protein n=1 Tax=Halorussus marinus TaxID=2505976 RepID=UPI001092129D|nr:hypothetical protein [Halorussus marinus]
MNLDSSFEDDLREAVLDEAEHELIGQSDNLVHQFVQDVHDQLRAYGSQYDYNVEPIIESLGEPQVDRSENSLSIRVGWEHEASVYFEFGTSDHTVEGDPLLVFEFDPAEYPYLAEMFPDGTAFLPQTHPSGLPESRAVRDALNELRREMQR